MNRTRPIGKTTNGIIPINPSPKPQKKTDGIDEDALFISVLPRG